MLAVIDYGVGNLFSISSSLKYIGIESEITSDKGVIEKADKLILPGVGAFGDAAAALKKSGLFDVVRDQAAQGKPLLGICLGMQLLFDISYEYGEHDGLSLIPGSVKKISSAWQSECSISRNVSLKIPHMGWNALIFNAERPESALYKYVNNGEYVYFVHSFYAECAQEYVSAYAEYGALITASAECGNVYGTQFHPEKSGETGLNILRGFCEI